MGFMESRAYGRVAELRVASTLGEAGWKARLMARHPDGRPVIYGIDLIATEPDLSIPYRVEVKREDNHQHTGNLAIEVQRGKAVRMYSGITLSPTDVTIHTLGESVVLYDTQAMRVWMAHHQLEPKPFRRADGGARGVLVPIHSVQNEAWCERVEWPDLASSRVWTCDLTRQEWVA